MERIPIQIRSCENFELELTRLNCYVSLRTTLSSLPGSVHWHINHKAERTGTLEFTTMPNGESWLSVHSNRRKPWIEDVLAQIT